MTIVMTVKLRGMPILKKTVLKMETKVISMVNNLIIMEKINALDGENSNLHRILEPANIIYWYNYLG